MRLFFQENACLGPGEAFPAISELKQNTITNSFGQNLQFCHNSMIRLPLWEGPGWEWDGPVQMALGDLNPAKRTQVIF